MKTLVVLIIGVNFTFGQIDTLQEALKYYPLQNGNYWEYMDYFLNIIPYEEDSSFFSIQVTGDTILSNNKLYKVLIRKSIPFDGYISRSYERIDSSTACIYRYSTDTLFSDNEYLFDSLLAEPADTFAGSFWGHSFGGGNFFQTVCLNEYQDTIWNFATTFKVFQDESDIPAVTYTLAKGLGFTGSSAWELAYFSTTLRYAEIDGVEYGTQITGTENTNNNQSKIYFLYQNYPNPFNPATNIEYLIPQPGLVNIKVYDVLGNEIETLVNEEKIAGRYSVSFDGINLASGIYFYLLRSGSFTQMRKMILLK